MSAEMIVSLTVAMLAISLALYSILRPRTRILTQEEQLERKLEETRATVTTLQGMLVKAQNEIEKLKNQLFEAQLRIKELETNLIRYDNQQQGQSNTSTREILYVVVGNDPMLTVDLQALRTVERSGTTRIMRRLNPSKENIKRDLDRHRRSGKPIRKIHFAVHAGPEGIITGSPEKPMELLDTNWLSENLSGVEIAIIAGCASDVIGDYVGIVPYVITMREDVENSDAWQFAQVFWNQIIDGVQPEMAFDMALTRSPRALAEYVELHIA